MKLSEQLQARGFIHQFSGDSLENILDKEPRTFYLGVDPTAHSLTIGNLAAYMLARHLVDAGFDPILIVGGGTGMIGDPGGRDSERTLLDQKTLDANIAGIQAQVENVLGVEQVKVVNNADWLTQLNLIDFLRDVAKHFTINAMVKKDIVKNRLDAENPLSFTEFSYALLQAYDFEQLFKMHNCTLQIGGSDQWSNILAGVEYIRKVHDTEVYALTIPLIVNPVTGKKFGKSEDGALWLDSELTSPYTLYQYLLNTDDESIEVLLKVYTLRSLDAIADLVAQNKEQPQERHAQRALAHDVVAFVHGEEAASAAQSVSEILFGDKDIATVSPDELALLQNEAPSLSAHGRQLVDVLVESGLAKSKTDARDLIEKGGITVGSETMNDAEYVFELTSPQLLKKGRRNALVLLP